MITSQSAMNSLLNLPARASNGASVASSSELSVLPMLTTTPVVRRTAESLAETLIEMAEAAVAEQANNVRLVAGFRVLFVLPGDRRLDANMFYFVYSGVDNKGNSLVSEPMPLSVCVQLLQQLTATY